MTQFSPKISIITVVFNGVETLETTIKSVINQSYKNIEYIIIDGNSKDGTIDIVKKYNHSITQWISEPDNGIYDAMNKGLNISNGDYIWFMNSGDEIANNNTIQDIISSNPISDIYYGDTIMIDSDGNEIGNRRLTPPKKLTWKSFKKGMLVSHQSFIVKKQITQPYNLKYKFSADFGVVFISIEEGKNNYQYKSYSKQIFRWRCYKTKYSSRIKREIQDYVSLLWLYSHLL